MPRKAYSLEEIIAARKATRIKYYIKNREKILANSKRSDVKNARSAALRNKRISDPDWREKQNEKRRSKRGHPGPKRKPLTRDEKLIKKRLYSVKDRIKNRESYAARGRKWRADNRGKYMAYLDEYYAKNRGRICAQTNEWKKKHPEIVRANNARREKGILSLVHSGINNALVSSIYSESIRATKGTGIQHSVDHIIPTKHNGWHHQDNLQVMTKAMNASKQDNPFWLAPHIGIKDWRDVPRHLWPIDLVPKYLALIEKHKGETIRWDAAA